MSALPTEPQGPVVGRIVPIVREPDARLHARCEDATVGREAAQILADLIETCVASKGLGLAAPQIGVMVRAVVVVDLKHKRILAMLNPRIIKRSPHKLKWVEGCLSNPGVGVRTKRAYSVVVEAMDAEGHVERITAKEQLACAIQHELDHLDGITIFQELYEKGRQDGCRQAAVA